MDGIEIHGLDEFAAQIAEVRRKYPDAAEKELRKLGNGLKKKAIDKTLEGKVKNDKYALKKHYHISQTQQAGKTLYIEFNSDSPHYHLIERGHRMVTTTGQEVGFVPGVHMVEQSVAELEQETPGELEAWLDKLTEELK
jgi:hypothetical protein